MKTKILDVDQVKELIEDKARKVSTSFANFFIDASRTSQTDPQRTWNHLAHQQ